MKLFNKFLDKAISEAGVNEIRIKFIGNLDVFGKKKEKSSLLSELTNKKLTLTIAVNYRPARNFDCCKKLFIRSCKKNVKFKKCK